MPLGNYIVMVVAQFEHCKTCVEKGGPEAASRSGLQAKGQLSRSGQLRYCLCAWLATVWPARMCVPLRVPLQ